MLSHATPVALARQLLAELEARGTASAAEASDIAAALYAAVERAQNAWPDLDVPVDLFVAHIARHLPADVPLGDALERLHAADLLLALCCARGAPGALDTFDRAYAGDIALAAARHRDLSFDVDDLKQSVHQKLFVGDGAEPKIRDYSGQGPLRAWFRVTVARALLDARRSPKNQVQPSDDARLLGLASPERDPELEYLRRRYVHEFRSAFEQAASALGPEERNVLRAYYVHDLSIDQIAVMLGLHRSTAARRVATAKQNLLSGTRRHLSQRLELPRRDLESVMRLIESGLHVSLERLLS